MLSTTARVLRAVSFCLFCAFINVFETNTAKNLDIKREKWYNYLSMISNHIRKAVYKKMKWTSLNDLREKYLAFFESKGHLRLPSYPLIPHNDKSLLLINSGMAPMKKFFTGEEIPPRNRVTTCQKCIRTPDLE